MTSGLREQAHHSQVLRCARSSTTSKSAQLIRQLGELAERITGKSSTAATERAHI